MDLAAGTRLGPYEVLAKAGEGGMGVVYRARDTRREALPDAVPPPIRRLLERCLERDPKQRLRDIGEAASFSRTRPRPRPTLEGRPRRRSRAGD